MDNKHNSYLVKYEMSHVSIDSDITLQLDVVIDEETAKFIVGLKREVPVFEQIMNYMMIKTAMEK